MKTPSITIAAGTVAYPPTSTMAHPETADAVTVPIADFEGAPRLAVAAAHAALKNAGIPTEHVVSNAHAWVNYQGHDLWSPQHYIAHQLGAVHSRSSGVYDICNGGASAVELAAMTLLAAADGKPGDSAVTTTADIFAKPSFDRFTSDAGIWYGDAGSALVLTNTGGYERSGPRLLSAFSTSIPIVESMHRLPGDFYAFPAGSDRQVDVRQTKGAFLAQGGGAAFVTAMGGALRAVVQGALRDAGVSTHDPRVAHLFLPRIDQATIRKVYLPPLAGVSAATYKALPRTGYGHLGAGDTPVNLIEFASSGAYAAGDIALFVCAGAGFTVSCLCVEMPDLAHAASTFTTLENVSFPMTTKVSK
ncbi:MAG: hypothetical protein ACK5LN_05730 [Propioniciclava sp.]